MALIIFSSRQRGCKQGFTHMQPESPSLAIKPDYKSHTLHCVYHYCVDCKEERQKRGEIYV
jgi:hypothetical protein